MAEAVQEAGAVVDRERLQAARKACEVAILTAVNDLERVTGMEVQRVTPSGQKDGGLTRDVTVELVLR